MTKFFPSSERLPRIQGQKPVGTCGKRKREKERSVSPEKGERIKLNARGTYIS
jgi:hypothetical protein